MILGNLLHLHINISDGDDRRAELESCVRNAALGHEPAA